ncbi:MAG: hypothetical protein WC997_16645 [Porticoccaceae bacterium]
MLNEHEALRAWERSWVNGPDFDEADTEPENPLGMDEGEIIHAIAVDADADFQALEREDLLADIWYHMADDLKAYREILSVIARTDSCPRAKEIMRARIKRYVEAGGKW